MIKIENLSYSYGKIQALNGVNLEVKGGQIMSIIGANGAGKSTLLKCISGLFKIQQGSIFLDGAPLPPKSHLAVKAGIALVPEGRWIFPNLTVTENLLLGGYLSKERKQTITEVHELFPRLKERSSQRAGTLSGGEQQMLAIGRGLMSKPRVLLLDEPSLGLAPLIVNDIFRSIVDVNKTGVTVVLVEQNAKKALAIANEACLLETGRVVKQGPAADLRHDPDIVKAYLGG